MGRLYHVRPSAAADYPRRIMSDAEAAAEAAREVHLSIVRVDGSVLTMMRVRDWQDTDEWASERWRHLEANGQALNLQTFGRPDTTPGHNLARQVQANQRSWWLA